MPEINLNNTGGRVLIGNFVEERHSKEHLGQETDFNKEGVCASLALKNGNKDAITPSNAPFDGNSTSRVEFSGKGQEDALSGEARKKALLELYARANRNC
eukprot:m.145539 g.145539  ORF g.145539 m.145539 type:complete len:100 (+) comp17737_c0_seq1:98-397(+)